MTLLRAIFKNKKIKLDERELIEFNKIYRLSYLLLLICTWVYFEFFENLEYSSFIFAGYVGVICLIGVLRMTMKGLRISFRNLDLLIPGVYFNGLNSIGILSFVSPIITDIYIYLLLLIIFGILIWIIFSISYKYGIKKLEKELEE
ncbi:hypothetical protein [Miniphocaeibacter halophilus]|uniref:Uncharacterized protein n=1 Tax=Miniphocaeibacter halophilus TaxID=2931922 RepID=A0AC61MSN3_9FIRM|nr:hypothetical protein [Miniphocaeibacter halophilus]QQK08338.1 hypothetical protein JFY71_01995 [Miniphocaeibacter halophilus]